MERNRYYPNHERVPNVIVRGLYSVGYFVGDFVPLLLNLIDGIYWTVKRLVSFIVGLLVESSIFVVIIGSIFFSVSHSIEQMRKVGATGGLEYVGVLMFEVIYIGSSATLTGFLIKKKKPVGFIEWMGLIFTILGFFVGLGFVWWSNVNGMAPTKEGFIIGSLVPVLVLISEGILAFRYLESEDVKQQHNNTTEADNTTSNNNKEKNNSDNRQNDTNNHDNNDRQHNRNNNTMNANNDDNDDANTEDRNNDQCQQQDSSDRLKNDTNTTGKNDSAKNDNDNADAKDRNVLQHQQQDNNDHDANNQKHNSNDNTTTTETNYKHNNTDNANNDDATTTKSKVVNMNERRKKRKELDPDTVIAIFQAKGSNAHIGRQFGVSAETVRKIKLGQRHAEITAPYRQAK